MPIHNWMSGLKGTRKLVELCLPGSHDAGVYQDQKAGVKPGSSTRCQYSKIWKQAMSGSRVFDIRCFLRTTGVFKKKKTPTMGHFFKEGKDGYLGEYGGTLMSALDDAATFLKVYPTEFLIFRIGHTKCTGNVADALKQFREKNGSGHPQNAVFERHPPGRQWEPRRLGSPAAPRETPLWSLTRSSTLPTSVPTKGTTRTTSIRQPPTPGSRSAGSTPVAWGPRSLPRARTRGTGRRRARSRLPTRRARSTSNMAGAITCSGFTGRNRRRRPEKHDSHAGHARPARSIPERDQGPE